MILACPATMIRACAWNHDTCTLLHSHLTQFTAVYKCFHQSCAQTPPKSRGEGDVRLIPRAASTLIAFWESFSICQSRRHSTMTQHFLARQLAISFAHSKIMKPKESAECNQTLSWTDRWCLGTDRWGLGTRQSVPRLSRVSLLRLCVLV